MKLPARFQIYLPMNIKSAVAVALLAFVTIAATPPVGVREEPVAVAIAGGTLRGTLTIPETKARVPVALIIAGTGPTDRDGNSALGLRTDAYKKLATALAARGIASLRYDKRGVGTSSIAQTEADVRFDDFANDAQALASRLESDPRFSSVSIIGHSEGSLIGMLVARRDLHIRRFVSLEGAGRNLATIINEQVRANPADSPAIIKEVETYNQQLLAGRTVANPDPLLGALFRPSVQPFLISEYRYDPAHVIADLTIPVLIVSGSHDIQISPADAQRLKRFDPRATVVTITGMNHILVDAPSDRAANLATYDEPARPLDATLVNDVASFLLGAAP